MANDLAALVPSTVNVVFQGTGAHLPANGYYSIPVTLASLKLTQYAKITGAPWTKALHRYEAATFPAAGAPSNLTTLTALANQIVTDWYLWQLARLDQQFDGYLSWTPEGMHDLEWRQWHKRITTRVMRGPTNPQADLLYTFGGSVVNFNTPTTWNLNSSLTLSGPGPLNIDITTVNISNYNGTSTWTYDSTVTNIYQGNVTYDTTSVVVYKNSVTYNSTSVVVINSSTLTINAPTVNISVGVWVFDSTTNVTFNGVIKLCGTWVINMDPLVTLVADTPNMPCPAVPWQRVAFGGFKLQGMVKPALALNLGNGDLMRVIIVCEDPTGGYITNEDVAASANARFTTPGGLTLQMAFTDTATCDYDQLAARWRVVETTGKLLRPLPTPTIAANTNNLALDVAAEWLEINCTVASDLTGLTPGIPDRRVILTNTGAATLTLKHNSGSSAVGNRFFFAGHADIALATDASLDIGYDGTYWRDMAARSGLTGGGVFRCRDYYRQVGTATPVERWYLGGDPSGKSYDNTLGAGFSQNALYAIPFLAARGGTLDRIGFYALSSQANTHARVGIYTNTSDTDLYPSTLVVDGGSQTTSVIGAYITNINQALTPGALYWFVFVCDSTVQFAAIAHSQIWPILGVQTLNNYGVTPWTSSGMWKVTFTYAALPGTFTTNGAVTDSGLEPNCPLIAVRFSA